MAIPFGIFIDFNVVLIVYKDNKRYQWDKGSAFDVCKGVVEENEDFRDWFNEKDRKYKERNGIR